MALLLQLPSCHTNEAGSRALLMQVLGMISNQHYLYRMTVLVAITSLASVVTHETLYQHMLPVVVNCGKDQVCTHIPCVNELLPSLVGITV